ncbi:MAG: hypothetical protein GY787_17665, partial [Alteromonadales bacterium]|nr:hypothetical protein [Alteromonadales bacterium]
VMEIGRGIESIKPKAKNLSADILLADKSKLLLQLFLRYLPAEQAEAKLNLCYQQSGFHETQQINVLQLSQLRANSVRLLAGIIGMAAADKAIHSIKLFTSSEQKTLTTSYAALLVQVNLTPDELLSKVDFYQEKQALLEDHASLQEHTIEKLKIETEQTQLAKKELDTLNQELESRVKKRTEQLSEANDDLTQAMANLESTQDRLLEAGKMASLGLLVAGVAHEINTPIGIVLTAISSIEF